MEIDFRQVLRHGHSGDGIAEQLYALEGSDCPVLIQFGAGHAVTDPVYFFGDDALKQIRAFFFRDFPDGVQTDLDIQLGAALDLIQAQQAVCASNVRFDVGRDFVRTVQDDIALILAFAIWIKTSMRPSVAPSPKTV